jgi:hypothetical protein
MCRTLSDRDNLVRECISQWGTSSAESLSLAEVDSGIEESATVEGEPR